MGFFSIIETFFFISLGITILLVALLVYHFKQRVSSLEQKYESLFDIVSNVAKQLSNIQSAMISAPAMQQYGEQHLYQQMNELAHLGNINIPSEYHPHTSHNINTVYMQNGGLSNDKIIQEHDDVDDYGSEDDDSENDESDDESENESEDNDSSEDDSDNDNIEVSKEKIIVSDDENGNLESVKIINLNVNVENTEQYIEKEDSVNDIDVEIYELPEHDENIVEYTESNTDESHLLVRKIDELVSDESVVIVEKTSAKELYKKMTLSNLKATVISKGLCSDPSKMKKNELLKLLEEE